MFKRSALMYQYDKTLGGFLCCVYSCYQYSEIPSGFCGDTEAPTLFEQKEIFTEQKKSRATRRTIEHRLGKAGYTLLANAFLYGGEEKEMHLLQFLLFALKTGPSALRMRGHPLVSRVYDMERAVLNEAHLFLGFIRFSDHGGALSAVIEPKHFVLPKIRAHFCDRFPNETFLIFDKTHHAALLHRPNSAAIVPLESFTPAASDDTELLFCSLWKRYHQTIAILERKNERCQNTHLPKRFRGQMTEFSVQSAEPAPASLPDLNEARRCLG